MTAPPLANATAGALDGLDLPPPRTGTTTSRSRHDTVQIGLSPADMQASPTWPPRMIREMVTPGPPDPGGQATPAISGAIRGA
jgi:hypothetical protein